MSRRARYLLRLGGTFLLLAVLALVVDAQAALARLKTLELAWIAVALACFSLQTVLMAWRWQITAHRLGATFGLGLAVREYYLSQLVNLCLPGGVLGDAGRAVRSVTPGGWREGEGGLVRAAHAVMIERLLGQVAMLLIAVLGVVLVCIRGDVVWSDRISQIFGLAVLGIGLGAVMLFGLSRRIGTLARFWRSFAQAVLSRQVMMRQSALSLAIALLMILAFVACARATGTELPAIPAMALVPVILTTMLLPVSIGGWGLREGAAAALFPLMGAGAEAGVAAGIAYGLALLLACLPGLLVLPFERSTRVAPGKAMRR